MRRHQIQRSRYADQSKRTQFGGGKEIAGTRARAHAEKIDESQDSN